MAEQGRAELIQELEQASRALIEALQRRDPRFLEHLERREHAIRRLSDAVVAGDDGTTGQELALVREMGAAAVREAELIREETRHELLVLGSQRRLAHSLEAARGDQYAALDLKV